MNPLQKNYEAMEDALLSISGRNEEFKSVEEPEQTVLEMTATANAALKIIKEAPITKFPPMGKVTVITVRCNDDFWIVLHTPGNAKIMEFRYGDEGTTADSSQLAQNCSEFFGLEAETLEVEPNFQLEGEPGEYHWELKSPSGKVYSESCEGDCLKTLLTEEPDAILKMALQPA